jgi:hypothetical protein
MRLVVAIEQRQQGAGIDQTARLHLAALPLPGR